MAEQRQYAEECYACPVGTAFAAVRGASPDTTEHLIRAGRELVLALRGMLDVATSFLDQMDSRRSSEQPGATIQRIDIKR